MVELTDAIDIHVHAAPELFPRIGDTIDIARRARELGMSGFVCKCHHEPTTSRATLAQRAVEGVRIWGGIVLNGFVGGINPIAVASALQTGARIVWMPTMHAKHHIKVLGAGTYGIRSMTLTASATLTDGIEVVDPSGVLLDEARTVIQLVADADATIATAHLSPTEILAVAKEARRVGARCVVTHAFFPEHTTTDVLREAADEGAWIELSAVVAYPMARHFGHSMTLAQAGELIEMLGSDRVVLSSDAGQIHNPWPPDVLRAFANALVAIGIPGEDVRRMLTVNPRHILGIDDEMESQLPKVGADGT